MSESRRDEVDVLRGVALFGICVVNMPFLAGIDPLVPPAAAPDRAVAFLVAMLFQGKFFVLFSFLFGWGFAVQQASAARQERGSGARYGRRLAALLAIGVAHALFVFTGDILVLYALLGALLWLLRDASSARLFGASGLLLGVAFVALGLLGVVLDAAVTSPGDGNGYLGTFADAFRQRLREWPLSFGFVLAFNGPVALAAFCAGLGAARLGFFEPGAGSYAWLRSRWPGLLATGLATNAAYASSMVGLAGDGVPALVGFAALAIGGPCLASVYLVVVVELVRRACLPRALASAGRLSLSAYVAQGVLAGLLFNGYGLGLYGRVGDAACLGIAGAIYALVHSLADFWWRAAGQGPLERLLRATAGASVSRPRGARR